MQEPQGETYRESRGRRRVAAHVHGPRGSLARRVKHLLSKGVKVLLKSETSIITGPSSFMVAPGCATIILSAFLFLGNNVILWLVPVRYKYRLLKS